MKRDSCPCRRRFLQKIRELTERHGIVMIADEVQCGSGRTGKLFAIEHYGIVPDMIVTAKSMGAGMPIGGVTGRAEIMDSAHLGWRGQYIRRSAAVLRRGHRGVDHDSPAGVLAYANHLGVVMRKILEGWKAKYPLVGDVRGLGPMLLIELVKDRDSKESLPAADALAIIRDRTLRRAPDSGRTP